MLAALTVSTDWLNKIFKFLSMLITGLYPAGFWMLVYLLEIDSPLVALPYLLAPYLLKTQTAYRSSFAPGVAPKTTQQRCMQSPRAQCQHEEDTSH